MLSCYCVPLMLYHLFCSDFTVLCIQHVLLMLLQPCRTVALRQGFGQALLVHCYCVSVHMASVWPYLAVTLSYVTLLSECVAQLLFFHSKGNLSPVPTHLRLDDVVTMSAKREGALHSRSEPHITHNRLVDDRASALTSSLGRKFRRSSVLSGTALAHPHS